MCYNKKITTMCFLRHFLPPETYRFFFFLADDIEHCNCYDRLDHPVQSKFIAGGRKTNTPTVVYYVMSSFGWCARRGERHCRYGHCTYAFLFFIILNILFFFNPSELRARFIRVIKCRRKTKIIIKNNTLH